MANNVLDWVWEHSRSKHGARLVLLAIADRAQENGSAWMSMTDIKRRTQLGERAAQAAVIELAKAGELEVGYQEGPHGCNRYRVLTSTPAKSAGAPQKLRGAESAPPQNLRGSGDAETSQVKDQDPAESAPPQNLRTPPAKSAGKPISTEEKSSTKTSPGGVGGDSALFGADGPAPKRRAARNTKPSPGPDFDRWYDAYPVHKARGDAEKAWEQTSTTRPDMDTLMAATVRYRQDPQVIRGYGKYPAGWLRSKCWLDEPIAEPHLNGHGSPRGGATPLPANVSPRDEHRYRR